MLQMEAARLEQDKKMVMVMEGIMARLGGLPLPDAGVMTPPRGGVGSNGTQQWQHTGVEVTPAQQPGEAPHQGREPPATNSRPAARQTVAPPVPEAEAARGRAMEAAMQTMVSTGGEALLQLLRNSGHEGVVSMLTVEGTGPSTQK